MNRLAKGVLLGALIAGAGCTSGSAYVGVYGAPVYGPGPWGPYGGGYGPYGPYGGGVWVGVPICCDEQQEEEPQPEAPDGVQEGERSDEQEELWSGEPEDEPGEEQGGSPDRIHGTVELSSPWFDGRQTAIPLRPQASDGR